MAKVLVTYNIKGVGKPSAAVNLSYLAARDRGPTLLWDLDPQGASTYLFRIRPEVRGGGRRLVKLKSDVDNALRVLVPDTRAARDQGFGGEDRHGCLDDHAKAELLVELAGAIIALSADPDIRRSSGGDAEAALLAFAPRLVCVAGSVRQSARRSVDCIQAVRPVGRPRLLRPCGASAARRFPDAKLPERQ